MTAEPLTPDAVRALVAETEHCARLVPSRHSATRALIERLAAALSATLPREDADLDAIESRAAWAGSYSTDGVQAAAERFRITREDVPALIGRVRAAEGERDNVLRQAAVWEGLYGDARAALAQAAEASRTVETAEEWELGVGASVKHVRLGWTGKITALDPPWGWRVQWQGDRRFPISTEPKDGSTLILTAAPPTPEEAEKP